MTKIDLRKKFLKLAYEQLHPDLNSLAGLEQALSNWYCFQYNVPPNDDKLIEMTVEELLVLYHMHQLRNNPQLADEITVGDKDSYEDWLKKEMGEAYVDETNMVSQTEAAEQEEQNTYKKLKETLPDRIETDFSSISNKE